LLVTMAVPGGVASRGATLPETVAVPADADPSPGEAMAWSIRRAHFAVAANLFL